MPTLRSTVKSLSSNVRFVTRVFVAKDCWIYTREKHILNVFPVTIAYILDVTKAITLKLTLPDILPAIFPLGKSVFKDRIFILFFCHSALCNVYPVALNRTKR